MQGMKHSPDAFQEQGFGGWFCCHIPPPSTHLPTTRGTGTAAQGAEAFCSLWRETRTDPEGQ